jgi:hypothetical protein
MPSLSEWWSGTWDQLQHSPAIVPSHYQIPSAHLERPAGERFRRDKHYFTVKINRAFLRYGREYWTTYAPMALAVSEFKYDGEDTVVPFVVGPSLLEKGQIDVPASFLFADTKVAGKHPYKGGGLKLTVVLYGVKRTNIAEKLLRIVENLASVIDLSQTIASYLKIAHLLVRTVGEVIADDKDNRPIIGLRREFDADEGFNPGSFALIDSRNARIDRDKLWLRNSSLYFGENEAALTEFNQANYVLYSIGQTTERDDFEQLSPIHELWTKVKYEASVTQPDNWNNTKRIMSTLYQAMVVSPDLTEDHANELNADFKARMVRIHEGAKEDVEHGAAAEADALSEARREADEIMRL